MKTILFIIIITFTCSCSKSFKEMSFMTKYNYYSSKESAWRGKNLESELENWVGKTDTSLTRLLKVSKGYTKNTSGKFVIKNKELIQKLDSIFKDTSSNFIRFIVSYNDSTVRYIFFTTKVITKKSSIIDFKNVEFRYYKWNIYSGKKRSKRYWNRQRRK